MRLTVIGAGPAYSDDPDSIGACYLIQHGGEALVLDLGHGAFSRLASRISPERLAGIAISHLHPDHFVDLVPARHFLRYQLRPAGRVAVHAPRAIGARLDALHADPAFTIAALDIVPLAPGARTVGPFRLEATRVTHTDDSYAFRVSVDPDDSPGLVYSGDVADADDLRPLIRAGDALLVEASFGAGPVAPGAKHLNGPAVGRLAATTRPGRVLLTHLLPGFDPVAAVASVIATFDGPVSLVRPGLVIDL